MDMIHDLDLNINLRELLKDNGFNERELEEYDYWFGGDGVAESKIRGYKPSGKGYFGNIYTQFKGKVMEGINFLSRVRGGVLQGVWHRKGIGDIDLVWGDDGGGLCHILKKHINDKDFKNKADFVNRLNDIVNNGNVEFENGDKVVLKKDGYVVTIRKNIRERGKKIADENWVLTAYNKDAPATTTAPADGTHGSTAVAPGASSAAKLGNNVGNAVNKGENVSEPEVWEQSHDENVGERTHERTSLQNGVGNRQTGARPAQGTATTTDEGSLRAGEKGDVNAGDDVQEPEAWGKKDLLSKAEHISNGMDPELLFRDSIEDDDNTARETYNAMADEKKNIIREAWQDSMINVRNLQEAVLKQRGEKAEAWEDAYNEENRMHGRSRAESEYFTDNFYKPLLKAVNAVAKAAKVSVGDVTEYMMAKHGLERNIVFASRDAQKAYDKAQQKAQEEYDALMNAAQAESDPKKKDALEKRAQKVKFPDYDELYNHYRGRDYSGLTDLTGKDDVQEAEAEAQRIVADMESRADTSELWKATNAATEWTLKKAYESGMMSRDNYDQVRSMFNYYIPLRGWEEDTAEDLYDYVGGGNKGDVFSPTVHKAWGRRTQADNPIAYIGSMAVSAIVQGNKNKVKQTFMRFAENHPTNLVTVSEMWYRNYGTDAAPDWREAHEHYAPFCRSNKPISRCKNGLFTTRKSLFRKKTVKPIPPISTHIITF